MSKGHKLVSIKSINFLIFNLMSIESNQKCLKGVIWFLTKIVTPIDTKVSKITFQDFNLQDNPKHTMKFIQHRIICIKIT